MEVGTNPRASVNVTANRTVTRHAVAYAHRAIQAGERMRRACGEGFQRSNLAVERSVAFDSASLRRNVATKGDADAAPEGTAGRCPICDPVNRFRAAKTLRFAQPATERLEFRGYRHRVRRPVFESA